MDLMVMQFTTAEIQEPIRVQPARAARREINYADGSDDEIGFSASLADVIQLHNVP
jgi:hypothetical protein